MKGKVSFKEIQFILKRIREQEIYIKKIKASELSAERKKEIIDSAKGVKDNLFVYMEELVHEHLLCISETSGKIKLAEPIPMSDFNKRLMQALKEPLEEFMKKRYKKR